MPLVDYNVVEDRDFTPVEDGIYDAQLTNWDLREPKEAGKFPYYNLEFTASEEAGIGKRKFWVMSSIAPAALWKFKQNMLILGANPADMEPGSQVDTDDVVASCLGASCRLVVKKTTYQDKERNEVSEIRPAPLPF